MNLIIREITKTDILHLNKWRNKPEIIEKLGSPFRYINQEVDEIWFASYLSNRSNNIRLIVADKKNNNPIGAVYLLGIDWISRSGEFAIWIGDVSSQNRGVGTFATRHMLSHAFNDLGLNRIHLTALTDNQAAIKLYKKFGFQTEGLLRQATYKNGRFCDMIQMSLLASEFTNNQENS